MPFIYIQFLVYFTNIYINLSIILRQIFSSYNKKYDKIISNIINKSNNLITNYLAKFHKTKKFLIKIITIKKYCWKKRMMYRFRLVLANYLSKIAYIKKY